VQVVVKFFDFRVEECKKYGARNIPLIDDVMRIRVLKIFKRYTQQNVIDFSDYIVVKFPFRINANLIDMAIFRSNFTGTWKIWVYGMLTSNL